MLTIKSFITSLAVIIFLAGCNNEQVRSTVQDSATNDTSLSEDAKAEQLFDDIFEQSVARSPEAQTFLGRGTNMDKWDDLSAEFEQQSLAINKANLARVKAIDTAQLSDSNKLSLKLMQQQLENDIEDYRWRLYNYPVNQMFGTHSSVPSLLINQHRIQSVDDAKTYIARINNVGPYFGQLMDGLKERAVAGIIPPKFVFPHIVRDSQNIITGAPFDDGEANALLTDFTGKLNALELSTSEKDILLDEFKQALMESFKPAYENLIAYLTELETQATTDDGIWKWQNGDDFFNVALARTTTTDLTAKQIHEIGLNEVARIHDEMRAIKEKVGFSGDLQAFMAFMRNDDQFYYPGNQQGKDRYLNEAAALIDNMKSKLDTMFVVKPKSDIQVKAVEAFREQSAGKAFYQRPSEDGQRPGLYYANLYDMKAMPTYQMEALAYHEGIPGHHMQIAIAQELEDVPKFRKFGSYTAYIEGWGLYSEYLPKEFGAYSDPYSDFGRLAMELWRACRLVVDTGIHAMKWTRQQGIDYYVNNTPNAKSDAVKMVERHIVMPSQATAYKIGMLKILELRETAREKLGNKFDIREFHDQVLKYGAVPLNVMQDHITTWIDQKLAV